MNYTLTVKWGIKIKDLGPSYLLFDLCETSDRLG